jgi:hypothetical protein
MSFPSIEQFRHIVQNVRFKTWHSGQDEFGNPVYDKMRPLPVLKAVGTVKIHGTNAGVLMRDGELVSLSRNQELSLEKDNVGFAKFVSSKEEIFLSFFEKLGQDAIIYGEWCGKGIMKGCGIHNLSRRFIIFALAKIQDSHRWLNIHEFSDIQSPDDNIFNISEFPIYEIDIDFSRPELAAQELEDLTLKVENECPVSKKFGFDGIGEGIVWVIQSDVFKGSSFWFKTKGSKHKIAKTKKLVEVDVEKAETVKEFIEQVVSDERLEQGIQFIKSQNMALDQTSSGHFIKWVLSDVLKEESDRLEASNLKWKDVTKNISRFTSKFWVSFLNGEVGL